MSLRFNARAEEQELSLNQGKGDHSFNYLKNVFFYLDFIVTLLKCE